MGFSEEKKLFFQNILFKDKLEINEKSSSFFQQQKNFGIFKQLRGFF